MTFYICSSIALVQELLDECSDSVPNIVIDGDNA